MRTRLGELLDIHYPIIQAPMNWVSGAELAAAVSNAGGLGTLGPNAGAKTITADVLETGERLRGQIRKVRSLTKEPFAVNIAIGFGTGRQYSDKCAEVVVEENVPIVITSRGSPDIYTKMLKSAGAKVLHAISTVRHARKAEEVGVDGVIGEGFEAGGHKGLTELTTFVLIPMITDAVKIPVIAGGGIADARGLVAALALGADGVYIGTRFMATHESNSHSRVKEAVVEGKDVCTVSIFKDTGLKMLARDLINRFTQEYEKMRTAGATLEELNDFINKHSQYYAQVLGDVESSEICCGQVAGLVNEIISAEEVVRRIMENSAAVLTKVNGLLKS